METIYQIRIGGEVISQMHADELNSAFSSGELSPFHEVSPDGIHWYGANDIPALISNPPDTSSHTSQETFIEPAPSAQPPDVDRTVTTPGFAEPPQPDVNLGPSIPSNSPATPLFGAGDQPAAKQSTPAQPTAAPADTPSSAGMAAPSLPASSGTLSANSPVLGTDLSLQRSSLHSAPSAATSLEANRSGSGEHPVNSSAGQGLSATWYVAQGSNQAGPYDEHQLLQMSAQGTLAADTLVWKEGHQDWAPASTHFPSWFESTRSRPLRVPREQQSFSMLGLSSLVCAGLWLGGVGSALAVTLSLLAIADISRSEGYRRGTWIAILGGLLGVGGFVGSIFFWVWLTG